MPRGDGTGPLGLGPMTGRAAGYCAGYGLPGYVTPVGGRGLGGWGQGRAGGRGRGRRFLGPGVVGWSPAGPGWSVAPPPWPTIPYSRAPVAGMTRLQEIDALKGQAEYLKCILDDVRHRLDELAPKTANV